MDDFDRALAVGLRSHLIDQRLSNRELALAMRGLGFSWTGNTVTQITTCRRSVSVLEAGALCEALRVPLASLASDGRKVSASMHGDFGHWQTVEAKPEREATYKAARQLAVTSAEVDDAAKRLWGRWLEDERDLRLGDPGGFSPRALQARRGHVTRALLSELRPFLSGRKSPAPR